MNKKDQIGIFGLDYHNSLENFYINAFKKLKYNNIKFLDNKNYFYIFCFLKKFENKFFFKIFNYFQKIKVKKFLSNNHIKTMIIFKGMELNSDIYKIFKKKKIKLINIYTDDPFNFSSDATSSSNIIENIKNFDLFCIWSKKLKKKLEKKFKKNTFFYLPFAYAEDKHFKIEKSIKKNKISFIGSYDARRFKLLDRLNKKIDIYGNAWPVFKKHKTYPFIQGKELSKIVAGSEVCLNILKKQNFSSHNMRTFEIASMGGLMLTHRSSEQNGFFQENKACFMFEGIEELNKKIDYILKNPKKALMVRKKGYSIIKKHSYTERLKSLIKYILKNEKLYNIK
tara:strand:- start:56 stop:1072 length:1017 start_codon:yes stop_codon:yes gene_type:complete